MALGKRDHSENDHLITRLRDSEARYRALAELSADAVWVNYEGRVVYANAAAARVMAAADAEALRGLRPLDVVTLADRSIIANRINALMENGGTAGVVQTQWRRLDGLHIDVESAATRIPWEAGYALLVVFRDVSAHKPKAAGASEDRSRDIVAAARDYAMFTISPEGRIESWSPGAESIFGWSAAEVIGAPFSMTFVPEDRAAGVPEQELALAKAKDVAPDVRWHALKDGGRVFIEGTARALRDERGDVHSVLKIGQDATQRMARDQAAERLRVEAQREETKHRLVAAEEEERRRLARELHDEAGQHLTALGLGIEALSHVTHAGSEIDRRAGQLRKLAQALATDLHSIATRLRPRALDDFGLEAAIATYVDDWVVKTGIKADVHAHVGGRLPSVIESSAYRIVQEALTNIARHSEATFASVILERREDSLVVIVDDNGRGFDVSAVGQRAHSTSRPLGLLGIRERAELLDGTIDIESSPGQGATLYVRVPLASEARET